MSEEIFSKTGFRLYRKYNTDSIELEGVFKPLEAQGFGGNKEVYSIILYYNNNLEVIRVRNNWNGTGVDTVAHCVLSFDEAQKVKEKIMQAKNLDDFKQLLNNLLATC
jgi:hypothetical protein